MSKNMNINKANKRRAQKGLTILELVISMALGVTLMAGVVQVFVGMRQTDRTQEAVSRMQEAGRFAFNFLAQDIRSAGYLGCSSTMASNTINNTLNATPASFQPAFGIQGWEAAGTGPGVTNNSVADLAVAASNNGTWAAAGNSLDVTNVVTGTDVLRVWGVESATGGGADQGTLVSVNTAVTPRVINVAGITNVSAGDVLMLSDCQSADWIQPCTVTTVGGASQLFLSAVVGCTPGSGPTSRITSGAGADVFKLSGTTYYIGKRNNLATNPPALFRRTLGNDATADVPEELIEGIENMQILYGENINSDSDSSADRYVPANQVTNWLNVVSVRISLLVQSLGDNLTPTAQNYTFNGVVYDGLAGNGSLPPDTKLRRVFSTTINLRNRTL